MNKEKEKRFLEILFISILVLFFLQLISDFIETIYSFCLLTTGLNETVTAVLLLLTPLLLIFFGRRVSPFFILLFAELTIGLRVAEIMAGSQYKMVLSGLGVGCFMLFFPSFLNNVKKSENNVKGLSIGVGAILAVLFLIFLKSIHSSLDVTTSSDLYWAGLVLSAIAAVIAPVIILSGLPITQYSTSRQSIFIKNPGAPSVFLPAWGIISVLTMLYAVFGSPTVIARWSGGNYTLIIVIQLIITTLFGIYLLVTSKSGAGIGVPGLFICNIVFVALLTVFIYRLQIPFPEAPADYPIYADSIDLFDQILLFVVIIFYPILFINLAVFSQQMIQTDSSVLRFGVGFFFAAFFMLIIIFAHIFTTVYDYIPVIGPFFRDKFWLVHLVLGIGILFPMLWLKANNIKDRNIDFSQRDKVLLSSLMIGVSAVTLIGMQLNRSNPDHKLSENSLKVMTFNIQQGYDEHGNKNYLGQIELIKQLDPDIIGLQETDSVRIAGGNSDIIRYYAEKLNMYAYNGPTPVTGTFGIALLSKSPILNPQTFFMYSQGEQTATIRAQIERGETRFNVYVTHLGNDGDLVQQQAILETAKPDKNVILMGDFNFRPDTIQYQKTIEQLTDSWLKKWPSGTDDKGVNPESANYGRIDHIFISNELQIKDSRFILSDQSDHPALITELQL
ncbi:endonuclease/exonuclease/phosphatase family protein [bacterium]|nr:endonuclease/exonuclease/phosphatase family protein [bacterium]